METHKIAWMNKGMSVRSLDEGESSRASSIRVTQYASTYEDAIDRFRKSVNIRNLLSIPAYSMNSLGRWEASWVEECVSEHKNTARFGWTSRKKRKIVK